MSNLTLYHLSPSRFRHSIAVEGIRRSSMLAGRLVTHCFMRWPRNGDAIRIAELHDTNAVFIDVWKCSVEMDDAENYHQGEWIVFSDLSADRVQLIRTAKLEG